MCTDIIFNWTSLQIGHITTVNVFFLFVGRPQLYLNGGERERFFMVGQEHKIECDVYAIPRPTITWFFKPCSFYPKCSTESKPIPVSSFIPLTLIHYFPKPNLTLLVAYSSSAVRIGIKVINVCMFWAVILFTFNTEVFIG